MSWADSFVCMDKVKEAATKHNLDYKLMAAICQKESSGNTWAMKYEPGQSIHITPDYKSLAKSLNISSDTERICQMCSWGLPQVMGWIARKLGFNGHLTSLCYPENVLEYQAQLITELCTRFTVIDDVIAAYNMGSVKRDVNGVLVNQSYVDDVKNFMSQILP